MTSVEQLQERVNAAVASETPLRIRGGSSKDFYGQALQGQALDVSGYSGIVAYEPTELVVTVRCGTPLSELEAELDAQGQMLAFEPPMFGGGATVGGTIAAGLSGPRRAYAGGVKDYVLGAQLIDGRGQLLNFGGQVMKNVAGYDVSRLLAGSLGILGVITQVSLKVLPKPVAQLTLSQPCSEAQAIKKLNTWGGQPLPLSASAWFDGTLTIRLSGAQAAVNSARSLIGGEGVKDADAFWLSLREQTHPWFADAAPLLRASVASVTLPLELGKTLIEWGGAQRWVKGAELEKLRKRCVSVGGHATVFRGDKSMGAFSDLDAAALAIHRRLKAEFDPAGIFNRGRLFRDL